MKIGKAAIAAALCLGLFCGLAAGATADTLKIGVIGPLTGGGAPWGNAAAQAAKIAAAEANAKGGLEVGGKKYQVDVVAYDDQYKAADAIAAYNRLTNQDGVKYIIMVTSPSTLAVAPTAETDKVIVLSTAGVEKAIGPQMAYVFRANSLLRDYVPPTVKWVKEHVPGRRVVILNPNDESGWYSTNLSKTAYSENGFEILSTEMFERSQKDFQPLLTKVLGMKPDIIELASVPPATAGLVVRQARDLGYKGLFVKDAGAATKDILDAAGKDGAEGIIQLHYANPHNEGFQRIAAEYKKAIGQQPDDLMAIYYDGAVALLRAIQQGGDVNDTTKVSNAFFTKTFPITSVQGDQLNLGGKGRPGDPNQIMTPNYISVMKSGEPVIVGTVK
jgi:branched-chain amino acid transport system substrate-binding protein